MGYTRQIFGRKYSVDTGSLSATRIFQVKLDAEIDDIDAVAGASGVAQMGEEYNSILPQLVVVDQEVSEVALEKDLYQVKCQYGTDVTQQGWVAKIKSQKKNVVPKGTRTPYSAKPAAKYTGGRYIGPAGLGGDESESNYPAINRATDPFTHAPVVPEYPMVITYTRTVELVSDIHSTFLIIQDLTDYLGAMNSDDIVTAGIFVYGWELIVDSITIDPIIQADGTANLFITMTVIYDPDGHASPVLNAGYRHLVGPTGARVLTEVRQKGGQGSKVASLLDANGVAIKAEDLPTGGTGADGPPYFIVFPFRATKVFAYLDLPTYLI